MKYIVSLSVQVVVEAPNEYLAPQIALRDAESLLKQPDRYVSGATYTRKFERPTHKS